MDNSLDVQGGSSSSEDISIGEYERLTFRAGSKECFGTSSLAWAKGGFCLIRLPLSSSFLRNSASTTALFGITDVGGGWGRVEGVEGVGGVGRRELEVFRRLSISSAFGTRPSGGGDFRFRRPFSRSFRRSSASNVAGGFRGSSAFARGFSSNGGASLGISLGVLGAVTGGEGGGGGGGGGGGREGREGKGGTGEGAEVDSFLARL